MPGPNRVDGPSTPHLPPTPDSARRSLIPEGAVTDYQNHTIGRGENLLKISRDYNMPVDLLLASNPQITNPNVIFAGQNVKIPQFAENTYIVQPGDNLFRIAENLGVSRDVLLEGNPQIANPNMLYANEVLFVPVAEPAPPPTDNFDPNPTPGPVEPAPPPAPVEPTLPGRPVTELTRPGEVAGAFREAAAQVQGDEAKIMELFQRYAGRFNELAAGLPTDQISGPRNNLMQAFAQTGCQAGNVDTDQDGLTLAREILYGTSDQKVDSDGDHFGDAYELQKGMNPADRQTTMEAGHKPWTTTYWPMAGNGNVEGNPETHLWATNGALDKLDNLKTNRGDEDGAKALEFERKPALNWLIGEEKGHYIPHSTLDEKNAEVTTGVDLNRDGKITEGVEWDFIDSRGHFGKDGKKDSTMNVGWWGSCDKVALAGILFKDPKHDVTVDGVTFSKQDILGLLTVVANSQAAGTDFEGARYDARPDVIKLNNGRTINGKITSDLTFETADMVRRNGDYMTLSEVDQPLTVRLPDGSTKTYQPSEIRSVAREDKKDMEPSLFHETITKWLGTDGRPAAMDRDSGDHVWNYNFWKGDVTDTQVLSGDSLPSQPGFHGPANPENKVVKYTTDLYFGESNYPKEYEYWVEFNDAGKPVNSGWVSENPDFLWRPSAFNNWSGNNSRNPYVDPATVKEIYLRSIDEWTEG